VEDPTTQTLRAIYSLICRVVLLGIALPVLLADFPNYMMPSRVTQDWSMLVTCDALALLVPLLRWRKMAFLAGALALGVHYYFRHLVPTWDLAYMGVGDRVRAVAHEQPRQREARVGHALESSKWGR